MQFLLTLLAALGSGLIAGVFFAFSTFVMRALRRISPEAGIAAMQSINIVVINPMFLGVFLGTAVLSAVEIIVVGLRWATPGSFYALAGGALYIIGTFGVTIVCNVPLNDSLARVSINDPDGLAHWDNYLNRWTTWNHIRTIAAFLATGMYMVSIGC